MKGIVSAVDYLSNHKICHQDIKPQNIIISSEGIAKLVDFDSMTLFGQEETVSTYGYNTPDLYKSQLDKSPTPLASDKTDSYAIGQLLYQTLSTITNPTIEEIIQQIRENKLVNQPTANKKISEVMLPSEKKQFDILQPYESLPIKNLYPYTFGRDFSYFENQFQAAFALPHLAKQFIELQIPPLSSHPSPEEFNAIKNKIVKEFVEKTIQDLTEKPNDIDLKAFEDNVSKQINSLEEEAIIPIMINIHKKSFAAYFSYNRNKAGQYTIRSNTVLIDLINQCLHPIEKKRPNAKEILQHNFFQEALCSDQEASKYLKKYLKPLKNKI